VIGWQPGPISQATAGTQGQFELDHSGCIRMEWRFGPRCGPQLGWLSESGLGLFVPIGDRAVQVDEVQTVVNGQPTP
jgi:hypothetical protein